LPLHATDQGVLPGTPAQPIFRPTLTDLMSALFTTQPSGEGVGTFVEPAESGTRSEVEISSMSMPMQGPLHPRASIASDLPRVVTRPDEQTRNSPLASIQSVLAKVDPAQARTEGNGGRIIHVHIGSIEVQSSPQPAAMPVVPAPAAYTPAAGQGSSAGFDQHHRLRSYASWES
jgi:hypothetical protein